MTSMLARLQKNAFSRRTNGLELTELVATARTMIGEGGFTRPDLGRALAKRWPGRDPGARPWEGGTRGAVVEVHRHVGSTSPRLLPRGRPPQAGVGLHCRHRVRSGHQRGSRVEPCSNASWLPGTDRVLTAVSSWSASSADR